MNETHSAGSLALTLRHAGVDLPVTFVQRADGRITWKARLNAAVTSMGNAPTLFMAIDAARDALQCTDEEIEEILDERLIEMLMAASVEQARFRRERVETSAHPVE